MNKAWRQSSLVHVLFEQQVQASPDSTALLYQDARISYGQLNARANGLAQQLRKNGVAGGDVVAIYMDRSPAVFITMLAILKCGAAYLPLDVSNPEKRVQLYLATSDVKVVITDRALPPSISTKRRILNTSLEPQLLETEVNNNAAISSDRNEKDNQKGNEKAYVIFTSGSTGSPKGVVVPHRAIVRLVKSSNFVTIEKQDRLLQLSSVSFDASTFEIWGALLNGATLVIYPGNSLDIKVLNDTMSSSNVSILWLTSALFHLLATRFATLFSNVRVLLAGGDVLNADVINGLLDTHPQLVIINGYGPTENTTFTCCYRMTQDNRPGPDVPIGYAVSGTDLHILNEDFKPVAMDELGELYVSGAGVALGYLGETGVNDAFMFNADVSDGVIYRTGDLVRQNSQGLLFFAGRRDNLVKIRGFRVSIEEVESALSALNGVHSAAVLANKHSDADHHLVAYIQPNDGVELLAVDVKKTLSAELPDYMIPNVIHTMKKLPINANGKTDRAALKVSMNGG